MRYLALIYSQEPTEPPTETNGRQITELREIIEPVRVHRAR